MYFGLALVVLCALHAHGVVLAVALRARSRLRIFGVASGLIGLGSIGVYLPVAWQTRAFLEGRVESFAGMPVYNWAAVAVICSLLLTGAAAVALHRQGHKLSIWWRRR